MAAAVLTDQAARHIEEVGAREHEEGPEPLAAREERIAHRFQETPVGTVRRGNQRFEGFVYGLRGIAERIIH